MAKIKVDRSKFDRAFNDIKKKSETAAKEYLRLIQKEFSDEVVSFGKSAQSVISDTNAFSYLPDRDIILSGELKKSQRTTYSKLKAAVAWPVKNPENGYPYSNAVYHGWRPWGVGSFIPGRKYPELALKRTNLRLKILVESRPNKGLVAYIVPDLNRY
jgi:hypothetical protein